MNNTQIITSNLEDIIDNNPIKIKNKQNKAEIESEITKKDTKDNSQLNSNLSKIEQEKNKKLQEILKFLNDMQIKHKEKFDLNQKTMNDLITQFNVTQQEIEDLLLKRKQDTFDINKFTLNNKIGGATETTGTTNENTSVVNQEETQIEGYEDINISNFIQKITNEQNTSSIQTEKNSIEYNLQLEQKKFNEISQNKKEIHDSYYNETTKTLITSKEGEIIFNEKVNSHNQQVADYNESSEKVNNTQTEYNKVVEEKKQNLTIIQNNTFDNAQKLLTNHNVINKSIEETKRRINILEQSNVNATELQKKEIEERITKNQADIDTLNQKLNQQKSYLQQLKDLQTKIKSNSTDKENKFNYTPININFDKFSEIEATEIANKPQKPVNFKKITTTDKFKDKVIVKEDNPELIGNFSFPTLTEEKNVKKDDFIKTMDELSNDILLQIAVIPVIDKNISDKPSTITSSQFGKIENQTFEIIDRRSEASNANKTTNPVIEEVDETGKKKKIEAGLIVYREAKQQLEIQVDAINDNNLFKKDNLQKFLNSNNFLETLNSNINLIDSNDKYSFYEAYIKTIKGFQDEYKEERKKKTLIKYTQGDIEYIATSLFLVLAEKNSKLPEEFKTNLELIRNDKKIIPRFEQGFKNEEEATAKIVKGYTTKHINNVINKYVDLKEEDKKIEQQLIKAQQKAKITKEQNQNQLKIFFDNKDQCSEEIIQHIISKCNFTDTDYKKWIDDDDKRKKLIEFFNNEQNKTDLKKFKDNINTERKNKAASEQEANQKTADDKYCQQFLDHLEIGEFLTEKFKNDLDEKKKYLINTSIDDIKKQTEEYLKNKEYNEETTNFNKVLLSYNEEQENIKLKIKSHNDGLKQHKQQLENNLNKANSSLNIELNKINDENQKNDQLNNDFNEELNKKIQEFEQKITITEEAIKAIQEENKKLQQILSDNSFTVPKQEEINRQIANFNKRLEELEEKQVNNLESIGKILGDNVTRQLKESTNVEKTIDELKNKLGRYKTALENDLNNNSEEIKGFEDFATSKMKETHDVIKKLKSLNNNLNKQNAFDEKIEIQELKQTCICSDKVIPPPPPPPSFRQTLVLDDVSKNEAERYITKKFDGNLNKDIPEDDTNINVEEIPFGTLFFTEETNKVGNYADIYEQASNTFKESKNFQINPYNICDINTKFVINIANTISIVYGETEKRKKPKYPNMFDNNSEESYTEIDIIKESRLICDQFSVENENEQITIFKNKKRENDYLNFKKEFCKSNNINDEHNITEQQKTNLKNKYMEYLQKNEEKLKEAFKQHFTEKGMTEKCFKKYLSNKWSDHYFQNETKKCLDSINILENKTQYNEFKRRPNENEIPKVDTQISIINKSNLITKTRHNTPAVSTNPELKSTLNNQTKNIEETKQVQAQINQNDTFQKISPKSKIATATGLNNNPQIQTTNTKINISDPRLSESHEVVNQQNIQIKQKINTLQ